MHAVNGINQALTCRLSLPTSPLLFLSMPSQPAGGAKKTRAKALCLKEVAAKKAAVTSSVKNAASGIRATRRSGGPPAGPGTSSSALPDPEDQAADIMILRGEY
jgi:hypothetical protein